MQVCVALSFCDDKMKNFLTLFRSLNYGHEFWGMTERILPQVQATEITFLRSVYDVTLRDKVRSFQFRKVLNVEPLLLRIGRSQL